MKWEPGKDRSSLLITFAAISGTSDMPAFAFGNVARGMQASKVFFVDPNECIYQQGIPGIGNDFWEIAEVLRTLRQREGIKRTTIIGNSAGGFAALVVGALLGDCTVHVFNPPTLLTSPRHTHKPVLCKKILAAPARNKRTFNLAAFLREEMSPSTKAFVYYSRGDAIDRKRTPLLRNVPRLEVLPYNLPGHELARYLARDGTISRLLQASLDGDLNHVNTLIRKSRRGTNFRLVANLSSWVLEKARRRTMKIRHRFPIPKVASYPTP